MSNPERNQHANSQANQTENLCDCKQCGSGLVYPVTWEEAGDEYWDVVLRCPECEHVREDYFDQATVEIFDDSLNRATEEIVHDLRQLMRANFEDEIGPFVMALEAGHIVPDDF